MFKMCAAGNKASNWIIQISIKQANILAQYRHDMRSSAYSTALCSVCSVQWVKALARVSRRYR